MKIIRILIKKLVFSNRITAKIYYHTKYGNNISDDLLIARIRQIAHGFDHGFMHQLPIKNEDIFEIECLLNITSNRGLKFDDSIMWALGLYTLAKFHAVKSYKLKEKDKQNAIDNNSILSEIIRNRRSVRKWNNKKVNLQMIKNIIEISIWSPSSCNRQATRVIILEDNQKNFIKKYFPGIFWYNAPIQLLILCNKSVYSKHEKNFAYLDAGAFIQNMLLLLHEKGLGACWIGFRKWTVENELLCDLREFDDFYEYFNISKELIPISLIVVGEYDIIPNAPARLGVDALIIE